MDECDAKPRECQMYICFTDVSDIYFDFEAAPAHQIADSIHRAILNFISGEYLSQC